MHYAFQSSNLNDDISISTTDTDQISTPTPNCLGKVAPVWVPDKRVTMCQCCTMPFTPFTRRRHHCRACGKVICDDCSGRSPLEFMDFKADRVCPKCYAVLYEQCKLVCNNLHSISYI